MIEERSSVIQGQESGFYIFEDLLLLLLGYAAAKSLQCVRLLCDPIDGSLPGSANPWDSPGKNTGVGCHFLLQCMKVKSESEVKSLSRVRLLVTPMLLCPWDFPGKITGVGCHLMARVGVNSPFCSS